MTHAARKVSHPMVIIILTWYSVSLCSRPLTSISLMWGVILSRVAIVSLHQKDVSFSLLKNEFSLPQVERGHYQEVNGLLDHSGLMPDFLPSLGFFNLLRENWLKIKVVVGEHTAQ